MRGVLQLTECAVMRRGLQVTASHFGMARCSLFLAAVAFTTVGGAAMFPAPANIRQALPLAFEENRGQLEDAVKYVAREGRFDVFFIADVTRIVKRDATGSFAVDIRLAGARTDAKPAGSELLPKRTSYIYDADPRNALVDIPSFSRVTYTSIYDGIDLVYYGANAELEYDFIVAADANPEQIRLAFEGAESVHLSKEGDVVLRTPLGEIVFRQPHAYQDIDGSRRTIAASYIVEPGGHVRFRLGPYDRSHALVIDPVLGLSTNLWGSVTGVALDAARNIYVVGSTWTSGLPASSGYQTQLAGSQDAYVVKLNPSGTSVIYATYLGARRATTAALGIAVDASGSAYVTGTTASGYPVTPGAYQSSGTTFITKLSPTGNALAYSTYVPTSVASIAVDAAGNTYMTGTTATLTPTPGAFQRSRIGASAPYVAKLAANGAAMLYATYLGGSANDEAKRVAVDASGNAYVVGVARSADFPLQRPFTASLGGTTDAFVAKLDSTGSSLIYSTYLGGSGNERGLGIAVDSAQQAYVTGWTNSTNFPVTSSAFQRTIGYPDPAVTNAFITKLNAAGDGLVYSSYLGGKWCLAPGVFQCFGLFNPDEGIDAGTAVAVDAAGYAYVGGYVTSTLFPLVDSIQAVSPADADVWHVPLIAKVTPDGDRLVYATVVGTKTQDAGVTQIAIDGSGGVVAAGTATGIYFPLTPGSVLGTGNGFVFKLEHGTASTTVSSSINPAAPSQSLTLTAIALSAKPGSVQFNDGSAVLGSANVTGGRASLTVTLAPGVHRITATNSADNVVSPPYFQLVRGQ